MEAGVTERRMLLIIKVPSRPIKHYFYKRTFPEAPFDSSFIHPYAHVGPRRFWFHKLSAAREHAVVATTPLHTEAGSVVTKANDQRGARDISWRSKSVSELVFHGLFLKFSFGG